MFVSTTDSEDQTIN